MTDSKVVAEKYPKIPNADKDDGKEEWNDKRTFLDFPKPARFVFAGKPGCGKSYIAHHVIQAALKSVQYGGKPYDRIIAVVPYKNHKEWVNDGGIIIRTSLPPES